MGNQGRSHCAGGSVIHHAHLRAVRAGAVVKRPIRSAYAAHQLLAETSRMKARAPAPKPVQIGFFRRMFRAVATIIRGAS